MQYRLLDGASTYPEGQDIDTSLHVDTLAGLCDIPWQACVMYKKGELKPALTEFDSAIALDRSDAWCDKSMKDSYVSVTFNLP